MSFFIPVGHQLFSCLAGPVGKFAISGKLPVDVHTNGYQRDSRIQLKCLFKRRVFNKLTSAGRLIVPLELLSERGLARVCLDDGFIKVLAGGAGMKQDFVVQYKQAWRWSSVVCLQRLCLSGREVRIVWPRERTESRRGRSGRTHQLQQE